MTPTSEEPVYEILYEQLQEQLKVIVRVSMFSLQCSITRERPYRRVCLFLKRNERWNKEATFKGTWLFLFTFDHSLVECYKRAKDLVSLRSKIKLFHLALALAAPLCWMDIQCFFSCICFWGLCVFEFASFPYLQRVFAFAACLYCFVFLYAFLNWCDFWSCSKSLLINILWAVVACLPLLIGLGINTQYLLRYRPK